MKARLLIGLLAIAWASCLAGNRDLYFRPEQFSDDASRQKVRSAVAIFQSEKDQAVPATGQNTLRVYLIYDGKDGKPLSTLRLATIPLSKDSLEYSKNETISGIRSDAHFSITKIDTDTIHVKGGCIITYPLVELANGASSTDSAHGNIDYSVKRSEVKQIHRSSVAINGQELGETMIFVVWY